MATFDKARCEAVGQLELSSLGRSRPMLLDGGIG